MPDHSDVALLRGGPRRRLVFVLGAVLLVLVVAKIAAGYGPPYIGLVAGPVLALGLVLFARRAGLSWSDLGLSRGAVRPGLKYAAGAVCAVAVVYAVGLAVPLTRPAFQDGRYDLHPGAALLAAFVVVPLSTVLLEEIAFRGVLLGVVNRHRGAVIASLSSSLLFGLWHIMPSLNLNDTNQAFRSALGPGVDGRALTVLVAVGFTMVAGLLLCELRRRSGSLLAAAALHWATNGLGLLAAAALALG